MDDLSSKDCDSSCRNQTVLTTDRNSTTTLKYKVYKRRWLLLAILSILNISNSIMHLSAVAYKASEFYETPVSTINYLAVVCQVSLIPFSFIASWTLDTHGLRFSVILSAWLNCVDCVLRTTSAVNGIAAGSRLPFFLLVN